MKKTGTMMNRTNRQKAARIWDRTAKKIEEQIEIEQADPRFRLPDDDETARTHPLS